MNNATLVDGELGPSTETGWTGHWSVSDDENSSCVDSQDEGWPQQRGAFQRRRGVIGVRELFHYNRQHTVP